MNGLTFVVTIGKYAGFYVSFRKVKRVCLGWIAFDVHPYDLDFVLGDYTRLKKCERKRRDTDERTLGS